MLGELNYRFSDEAEAAFSDYIRVRMTLDHFAKARSIRNALDRARLRQANRLFAATEPLTKDDLITIDAQEIRASRVFTEGRRDADDDGLDQTDPAS